jgi:hypothetical protein
MPPNSWKDAMVNSGAPPDFTSAFQLAWSNAANSTNMTIKALNF